MNIAKKIEEQIENIEAGKTFTYKDFNIKKEEYSAASKSIERLIKKEIIKRISTGIFYKPKKTVFGELKPDEGTLNKYKIAYLSTGYDGQNDFLASKVGMVEGSSVSMVPVGKEPIEEDLPSGAMEKASGL